MVKELAFKEKIFIAWGGNQPLAKEVGAKLDCMGYSGIVGGGAPTDMFVGTQIFSQIKQSTQAIILVERIDGSGDAVLNYNDNLMFEWGYLTAKLPPDKIHVFLIDLSTRDLPSDLAGSWAREISRAGKSLEEIADEICQHFVYYSARQKRVVKLNVLNGWERAKKLLQQHNSDPSCSDGEIAHYILHSMESAYYYMENDIFASLLDKITPNSSGLDLTLQVAKANTMLFSATESLSKPLSFDQFLDLKLVFENKFDLSHQDKDLDLWLHFLCLDRVSLCYMSIAKNPELSADETVSYTKTAIAASLECLELLRGIAEAIPSDAQYTKLYEGYLYRNLQILYGDLGEEENRKECLINSVEARKQFYINYKSTFPGDIVLINNFAQEYYLGLLEQMSIVEDVAERITIKRTVSSYLSKRETEMSKQHAVLDLLRKRLGEMN